MAGRGLLGSSSTNQMMNSQGPIGMPNYSANQGNNSSLTPMQQPMTYPTGMTFGQQGNMGGFGQQSNMQQPMSSFGQSAQQPVSTNPFTQAAQQTANANLYGAQQATSANRINQATPYGNLQYTQTGTDQFGNPMWSANQNLAPELQGAFGNLTSQLSSQTANPFNASKFTPQKTVEGGGMEGWDKATNLLMSRLNPQIEQGQDRLKAQLANQGIVAGTEAYDRAMTQQSQKENDLRTQAQIAGSTVQNQMFNQNVKAGEFGNLAQSQDYLQSLGGYNLPLSQLGLFKTATSPNYINPYQQAATAGPDYLGAYTSSEAARIANMNAEAAKQAALTGGLFQMGGSILSNPQSLKDIYGLGKDVYSAGSSAYDYLKDLF